MAVKVVDASAVAALLFGEPEGAAIATDLTGHRLVGPHLLGIELANICLKKMRRHPEQSQALRAAFDLFAAMKIDTVEVEPGAALDLAEKKGLTAYDASHLWLARDLDADLVTLDRQLAAAYQVG